MLHLWYIFLITSLGVMIAKRNDGDGCGYTIDPYESNDMFWGIYLTKHHFGGQQSN